MQLNTGSGGIDICEVKLTFCWSPTYHVGTPTYYVGDPRYGDPDLSCGAEIIMFGPRFIMFGPTYYVGAPDSDIASIRFIFLITFIFSRCHCS